MIDLTRRLIFHGPNPYSREPLILAELTVDEASAANAAQIIAKCRETLVGIEQENIAAILTKDVTTLPEFVHTAVLALQNGINRAVTLGTSRDLETGKWAIFIGFLDQTLAELALRLIGRLMVGAADDSVDNEAIGALLKDIAARRHRIHPGSEDLHMIAACRADDIPFMPAWGLDRYWQYGWGNRSTVMLQSTPMDDSFLSGRTLAQKQAAKAVLSTLGLPTPDFAMIERAADIETAIASVGLPVIVKPVNLGRGAAVSAPLYSAEQVEAAFAEVRKVSDLPALMETYVEGGEYRLQLIDFKLVAVGHRKPPEAVGDGTSTVHELIRGFNRTRLTSYTHETRYLVPVHIDNHVTTALANQGLTLESVPVAGAKFRIRENSNVSTGGTAHAIDVATVDPSVRDAVEAFARSVNVHVLGLDYIATDIGKPSHAVGGRFIEANLMPGIETLTLSGKLTPADAGRMILRGQAGRIPVTIVIVPDDQFHKTLMVAGQHDTVPTQGWATATGAGFGEAMLKITDSHPWAGVRTLFAHRGVESAVIMVTSGQVRRSGMPVDRATQVILCDPELDAAWQKVLGDWSDQPMRIATPAAIADVIAELAQA